MFVNPNRVLCCGTYQGRPIDRVPTPYVFWLAGKSEAMTPDEQAVVRAEFIARTEPVRRRDPRYRSGLPQFGGGA